MRERGIEQDWCRRAKKLGYKSIKFVDPAMRGAPDRLVLGNRGEVFFIEFKRPGGRLSEHQIAYMEDLQRRGFKVIVHWLLADNDGLLNALSS